MPPALAPLVQARAALLRHRPALHNCNLRPHGAVPPPPGRSGSTRSRRSRHSSWGANLAAVALGPAAACISPPAGAAAQQAKTGSQGGAPSRWRRQQGRAASRDRCGCPSPEGRQQPKSLPTCTAQQSCCRGRCCQPATACPACPAAASAWRGVAFRPQQQP